MLVGGNLVFFDSVFFDLELFFLYFLKFKKFGVMRGEGWWERVGCGVDGKLF